MPRKVPGLDPGIGARPMTDAARQARHRAARAAGSPVTRTHRPADHRGQTRPWHDAVTELTELPAQYAAWREALPNGLQDGATAGALRSACDFYSTDLQAIDPPRGFGRD